MDKKEIAEVTEKAAESEDLIVLFERARKDTRLMAELLVDPDAVMKKNGMVADPTSEVYQEFRLRLTHSQNLLNKSFDDLLGQFGTPGRIPGFPGGGGIGGDFPITGGIAYASLVEQDELLQNGPRFAPEQMDDLKASILKDLRAELGAAAPRTTRKK